MEPTALQCSVTSELRGTVVQSVLDESRRGNLSPHRGKGLLITIAPFVPSGYALSFLMYFHNSPGLLRVKSLAMRKRKTALQKF